VPVEAEAGRLRLLQKPVEMLLEIGDPLLGIELHHFFQVAFFGPVHGGFIAPRGRPDKPICAAERLL